MTLEERIERIDELVLKLETGADSEVRGAARELVQVLMEFHGAGLERVLAILRRRGNVDAIMNELAGDELVRSLLLLHGLHPVDLETRVRDALDKTRPYLRSHGGNVELVSVEADGAVRLRMQGSCHGCPSSAVTLKLAIEQAIHEAAPDVASIVVVDDTPAPAAPARALPLVAIEPVGRANGHGPDGARWEAVPALGQVTEGQARVLHVGDRSLLFCRVEDTSFAYGDRCPACGGDLADASLAGRALSCPACGSSYDVVRAGRGLDQPDLHLDPFPLLVEDGRARVALAGAAAGSR